MGAHPGAGPEQGAQDETEPPEVAAVRLRPEQHLRLARGDGGGAGAATAPGAQHRHPVHRAPNQKAQGNVPWAFPTWPDRKLGVPGQPELRAPAVLL